MSDPLPSSSRPDGHDVSSRRVVAVVTAFRPEPPLLDHVALIRAQVDEVVVVDDGSGPGFDDVFVAVDDMGAGVVRLRSNEGIAHALNAGIRAAALAPQDLVVTFDQDSAIPAGFIDALVETWDEATARGVEIGLVCPELFANVNQAPDGPGEDGFLRAREPIQSGALYSWAALSRIGKFREDLFIDLVDAEHFLRLRRLGMEAIAVPGLHLPHELGRTYPLTFLGRQVSTHRGPLWASLSTPFRYYYRMRNRVIVNREYRSLFRREYLLHDTLREIPSWILAVHLAKPRMAMVKVLARGMRDGRRGDTGRIPEDLLPVVREIKWRVEPRSTVLR